MDKNKPLQPLRAIFLVLAILFITLLLPVVSSFEWDNCQTYNKTSKTVYINNLCIPFTKLSLGSNIAEMKLLTELNEMVDVGENIRVAEFELILKEDYSMPIKDLKLLDTKQKNKQIGRNTIWKQKIVKGDNKTGYTETWEDLPYNLKKGTYNIALFSDVLDNDKIEWIPLTFGEWIFEWANWTANSQIISGLANPTTGYGSIAVFNISGVRHAITGENSFPTAFIIKGYTWNGTTWIANTTMVGGISLSQYRPCPNVFQIDNITHGIFGNGDGGTYVGYTWNGTTWIANTTMALGLGDVGVRSNSDTFTIGSDYYLMTGQGDGVSSGFSWNGSGWDSYPTLVNGLYDVGTNSHPDVIEIGTARHLIMGNGNGTFQGFTWNGTGWTFNETVVGSLTDIGVDSSPESFENSGNFSLISGEESNVWNGWTNFFNYVPEPTASLVVEIISPENDYNSSIRTITFNSNVSNIDDLTLENVSFYINEILVDTNYSGELGLYNFQYTFPSYNTFNWTVKAIGSDNVTYDGNETRDIIINSEGYTTNLIFPPDNYNTTLDYMLFSCNATDPLAVYSLNLTLDGVVVLTEEDIGNLTIFDSVLDISVGTHYWNCTAWNNVSSITSITRSFTTRNISLNYPEDESSIDNPVNFNCTVDGFTTLNNISVWTNSTGNWEVLESLGYIEGSLNNSGITNPSYFFDGNDTSNGNYTNNVGGGDYSEYLGRVFTSERYFNNVTIIASGNTNGHSGANSTIEIILQSWDGLSWNSESTLASGNSPSTASASYNGNYYLNKSVLGLRIYVTHHVYSVGGTYNIASNFFEFAPNINDDSIFDSYSFSQGEDILWSCSVCLTGEECYFSPNNFTFIIDSSPPLLNLTNPIGLINYGRNGLLLDINWTVYDSSLDSCWYEYNSINTSVVCGDNSSVLTLASGKNNLTFYVNDTSSNLVSNFTSWNFKVFENSRTFTTPAQITERQYFLMNLTSNNSLLNSTFNYNGVNYSVIISGSSPTFFLNSSVNVLEGTNTFYWIFNYSNELFSSDSDEQEVLDTSSITFVEGDCGAGYHRVANITFADEQNRSSLSNMNIKYNFQYGITDYYGAVEYGALNNISQLSICINETDNYYLGYGEIEYVTDGYTSRRYYFFEGYEMFNTTNDNITLYSLANGDSTSFLVEIRKPTLEVYKEKYTTLLRWYPDLDEYKVVEMGKTDDKGQTVKKVKIEDVDYRIGVYEKNGTLIYLANPIRMVCLASPCSYTLTVIESTTDTFDEFTNIVTDLVYSEGVFTLTYNDPSMHTSLMSLVVSKVRSTEEYEVCRSNSTSFIGILTCNVSDESGLLKAIAYRTASPNKPIALLIIDTATNVFQGTFGLFLQFIIIVTIAFLGIISPVVSIIAGIASLLFGVLLFKTVTYPIFIGIAITGALVIHFMKRGGQ